MGEAESDKQQAAPPLTRAHLGVLLPAFGLLLVLARVFSATDSLWTSVEVLRRVGVVETILAVLADMGPELLFPLAAGAGAVRMVLAFFERERVGGAAAGVLAALSVGMSALTLMTLFLVIVGGLAAGFGQIGKVIGPSDRRRRATLAIALSTMWFLLGGLLLLGSVAAGGVPGLPVESVRTSTGSLVGWVLDSDDGGFVIVMLASDGTIQRLPRTDVRSREICLNDAVGQRRLVLIDYMRNDRAHAGRLSPAYRRCDDPALATP